MPLICLISQGSIRVYLYANDHGVPHIHVRYRNGWTVVAISDGSILAGDLRGRPRRTVLAWVERRRDVLLAAWEQMRQGGHPGYIDE